MHWLAKRKWLGLVLAGAILPISITCSPGYWGSGPRYADWYYSDVVIVDEYYVYDDCWTCGWYDWGYDYWWW